MKYYMIATIYALKRDLYQKNPIPKLVAQLVQNILHTPLAYLKSAH